MEWRVYANGPRSSQDLTGSGTVHVILPPRQSSRYKKKLNCFLLFDYTHYVDDSITCADALPDSIAGDSGHISCRYYCEDVGREEFQEGNES